VRTFRGSARPAPFAGPKPTTDGIIPTVVGRSAPVWLKMLESWQSAAAHPAVLAFDGLLVAAVFRHVATTTRLMALLGGAAFVLLSLVTGLASNRTSVQTQGIRWYLRPLAVTCALLVFVTGIKPLGLNPPLAAASLTSAAVYLILLRSIAWFIVAAARRRGLGLRRTLVIGTNARVNELANELAKSKSAGLRFAAGYTPTLPDTEAVLDGHAQAFSLLERNEIDHVLLVNDGIDESVFQEFVDWADDRRGYTLVLPLADIVRPGSRLHVGRYPVVALPVGLSRSGLVAKRSLDIVVSSLLIVLTLPLMVLIAAAILIADHSWVIFRQDRVGQHGEVFSLVKFRTMFGSPDEYGESDALWATASIGAPIDPATAPLNRETPLGRFLRRWDLDELPQLFNVLTGHMSLVGPRPERVSYVAMFSPAIEGYADRHRVRPGMTGWAQVNGCRGQTPLDWRTAFDNDYIDRWNFTFDLRILLQTLPSVFSPPEPSTDRLLTRRSRPGVAGATTVGSASH